MDQQLLDLFHKHVGMGFDRQLRRAQAAGDVQVRLMLQIDDQRFALRHAGFV